MIKPELLTAPILPQMVRFAVPNLAAMTIVTASATVETYYVGLLGVQALAGHAFIFPLVMLQHMMSAGALGGGVSSAVSRALGSGDIDQAKVMGLHALVMGALLGLTFAAGLLWAGPTLLGAMGAQGEVLDFTWSYARVAAFAIPGLWIMNALVSVLRGSGHMTGPAILTISVAISQMVLGGVLGIVLDLGIAGIAWGQVIAFSCGAVASIAILRFGPSQVRLSFDLGKLNRSILSEIGRVGGLACLSPIQGTLTAMLLTIYISSQGAAEIAGYDIGARLEFLLIPIAFSVGIGTLPLVGTAIGAGDLARARAAGWIGGLMGAVVLGFVGCAVAMFPSLWSGLFTNDPEVLAASAAYFRWAGPGYAFMGLGLCLYFASQAAGQVIWPIIAGTSRLVLVAVMGWLLMRSGASIDLFFSTVFVGMAVFGLITGLSVWKLDWGKALR